MSALAPFPYRPPITPEEWHVNAATEWAGWVERYAAAESAEERNYVLQFFAVASPPPCMHPPQLDWSEFRPIAHWAPYA